MSLKFVIWERVKVTIDAKSKHGRCQNAFNSLPNNKILDWSNFKAFADNKIWYDPEKLKFVLRKLENIMEKG